VILSLVVKRSTVPAKVSLGVSYVFVRYVYCINFEHINPSRIHYAQPRFPHTASFGSKYFSLHIIPVTNDRRPLLDLKIVAVALSFGA
jgi:hypothetical protein